jgi:hypothetical protein
MILIAAAAVAALFAACEPARENIVDTAEPMQTDAPAAHEGVKEAPATGTDVAPAPGDTAIPTATETASETAAQPTTRTQ